VNVPLLALTEGRPVDVRRLLTVVRLVPVRELLAELTTLPRSVSGDAALAKPFLPLLALVVSGGSVANKGVKPLAEEAAAVLSSSLSSLTPVIMTNELLKLTLKRST